MRVASWLVLTGFGASLTGCGSCDTRGAELVYRGGTTFPSGTYYQTSEIDEEYLHFPAGRTYDLRHDLAAAPIAVFSYLSFSSRPSEEDDEGNVSGFAPSAGNQTIFVADETSIHVRNDTCAEFYLRVVATTDPDFTAP